MSTRCSCPAGFPEAIGRRIGEYVASSFGLKLDDMDLAMIVGGYVLYFNKKGLA